MSSLKEQTQKISYPLFFTILIVLTSAFFYLGWRYDNKFTFQRHPAQNGVTWIDVERFNERPLLYLLDGWALYRDRLLTPDEIATGAFTPDIYLYIGRFSGFELGDSNLPAHGVGTYRMTVLTGNSARKQYALELTEIFSDWRLWINGELVQSVGFDDLNPPSPQRQMVTFWAEDVIEIVVAVRDVNGLYSGMIFPPAFGSPQAVGELLSARLIIRVAAVALAIFTGLFCLLIGFGAGLKRPYAALFLLCFFFSVCVADIIFLEFGIRGHWLRLSAIGYYGIFIMTAWIQGRLCTLPKKLYYAICGLGLLICASLVIQPFFPAERAEAYYIWGMMLDGYKWLVGAFLLVSSGFAVWKIKPYSKALLAGSCIFAVSLIFDRVFTLYEPILLGWPAEISGGLMIMIIAGILWCDTVLVYRGNAALEADNATLNRLSRLKSEYMANLTHETKTPLTVISTHVQQAREVFEEMKDESGALITHNAHLKADSKTIIESLDIAQEETMRLSRFAQSALWLAAAQENKAQMKLDMGLFLAKSTEAYRSVIEKQNNTLIINLPDNLPYVLGESDQLVHVMVNLLTNANSHTKDGAITVEAAAENDFVKVTVKDNGTGIDPGLLPHVFLRGITGSKYAGTGMGLPISKNIVESHGGKIDIKSEYGKGSTVIFTIPVYTE